MAHRHAFDGAQLLVDADIELDICEAHDAVSLHPMIFRL